MKLIFRPNTQAFFDYLLTEIDSLEERLRQRFEAENWSAVSTADLARAVEAHLVVTHAIHWFLPRQLSPGSLNPDADDTLPLRPNARRLRALLLTMPYHQWPYAVQRWLFLHGLVLAALATQIPEAGHLLPPDLLASYARELSRLPVHERLVLPIVAMIMDETRGVYAVIEFERRVAQRPAALATAWLSLLMQVKALGGVEATALARGEEHLLGVIRQAVATGKVKVPTWAKAVISRSERTSSNTPALDRLVDYQIVETIRKRATQATLSGAMDAVLSGKLDIIARAVRDRIVKTARRHLRREKVQPVMPDRSDGPAGESGRGASHWEDEIPSTAMDPAAHTVFADEFSRIASTPELSVILAGLVRGDTQKEIAARLGFTDRTVRSRIRGMKRPPEP